MVEIKTIALLCALRLFSVIVVQTFFSPDEYWQSLEISHKLAFGYGHSTWEWKKGIRSYFYPAVFALLYKILAFMKLDSTSWLVFSPRILQALLSAYSDYRFYKWCDRKRWSLFIIMTSWFWFYTGSRTLINTLEASLTTIALSFFPWGQTERTGFLWIVGLLVYIRPTSILTWLPLCAYHIQKSRHSVEELLLKRYMFIGVLLCSFLSTLDSYFHGSFVITPWEFVKINVFDGIGTFYGSHPFYWYLSSGLPAILGIDSIPFCLAITNAMKSWDDSKERKVILASIFSTIIGLSLISHKEFRFLLQVLPLCLYLIVQYLSKWSRNQSKLLIWFVAAVIFVANALPAGYLGFVHQQGTIKVMEKISDVAQNYKHKEGLAPKIFFLMPCHSTPYYSHVHANITMRFLTCEPNFKNEPNYLDEADTFYEAPMKWIRSNLPVHPVNALPTHVVVFDTLVPKISDFLSIYKSVDIFFHSDYLTSSRGGKNVILFERVDQESAPQEKIPSLQPEKSSI